MAPIFSGTKWGRFMGGAHDGEGLLGGLQFMEKLLGGTATEITNQILPLKPKTMPWQAFRQTAMLQGVPIILNLKLRFKHDYH